MSITVVCATCGLGGEAPEALAGQSSSCPRCGAAVVVPAAAVPDLGRFDPRLHVIDQFFSGAPAPRPPAPAGWGNGRARTMDLESTSPRPGLPPGDTSLRQQFAQLNRQREEWSAWRAQVEAELNAREQSVHEQARTFAAREQDLQEREQEVARAMTEETEWNRRRLEAQKDLAAMTASFREVGEATKARRAELEELEIQNEATQEALREAENRLADLPEEAARRQRAADAQLENRRTALGQAEQALMHRVAQAAESERQTRQKLEAWTAHVNERVRQLEEQKRASLAREGAEVRALQAKVISLSRSLEALRRSRDTRPA